ncbi:MAG: family 16 glycoside hydrolase [Bacteroidales bacterium]
MKTIKLSLTTISLFIGLSAAAQKTVTIPEISQVQYAESWSLLNREMDIQPDGTIHLNGKPGTGLLRMNDLVFTNGVIECDIMGRDVPGRSFVGIAFHGLNDSTYDAVYFRPFNFKNEERNGHSIQYISHPENTWYKLREKHPGIYENRLDPVPDPEDWFHVSIEINYPVVQVFVDHSEVPALKVTQLSDQKKGWIGFWVDNNSEGYFRNLEIITE